MYKRRCGSLRRDRTVAITFRLDKEDADALDYIAKILGVSRSW
ncbi:MAG: ribbon-helix-helix protein, CopG family, partial [Thermotogae bacterium]|nr:ribbon-helix-helix protein, CopG family [Thermotogota bacterium]